MRRSSRGAAVDEPPACGVLAGGGAAAVARLGGGAGAEGAAHLLPHGRDRLRPGEDHRPVLAHRHAAHLRGHVRLRPPGTAAEDRAAHCRRHARAFEGFPRLEGADPPRHLLCRRPGLQGPAARAGGRGLRLCLQALCRPGQQERRVELPGGVRHRRPEGAARQGHQGEEALRLRRAGRRVACAGPLHLRDAPGQAAAFADDAAGRRRPVRCRGARGGRVLWRQHRSPPGRHRALQAGAVAPQPR